MLKFIYTILAFVYLSVTSGLAVQLHYCMGKLANVSIAASEEKQCGKCVLAKKKKPAKCCKQHVKLAKLQSDHKHADNVTDIALINAVDCTDDIVYSAIPSGLLPVSVHALPYKANAPPLDSKIISPSYEALYCIWRI
ncbi:MAG: HYC_CC_PP family protein [Chitinophagaceae bacterium]